MSGIRAEELSAVGAVVAIPPRAVEGEDARIVELREVAERVPGSVKPPYRKVVDNMNSVIV